LFIGKIRVTNRYDFVDLSDLVIHWKIEKDGETVLQDVLPCLYFTRLLNKLKSSKCITSCQLKVVADGTAVGGGTEEHAAFMMFLSCTTPERNATKKTTRTGRSLPTGYLPGT
jgi:hypothetical protein